MTTKKGDRFLTCLEACDTIILLSGMDIKSIIMNSDELLAAYATILRTRLDEVPDYWAESLARLKTELWESLGGRPNEDFDSSTWAKVFNV